MSIGVVEAGIVLASILLMVWLLPKALPQLGKGLREFQDEVRRKE